MLDFKNAKNTIFFVICFVILMNLTCLDAVIDKKELPVVKTSSGPVRGYSINVLNRTVYGFSGIPYAIPPVGNNRFRRPFKLKPWTDIRVANKMPPACMQERTEKFKKGDELFIGEEMLNSKNVSENCLYLNIWVPETILNNSDPSNLAPMLVWIHGGGYMTGSSSLDIYDGRYLAAYGDVIVASLNYRLGVFGFLRLPHIKGKTEEAPANVGLLDQIFALRWLKENAKLFGGDADLITLMGQSAGASSVHTLLISPLSKGLVKRAFTISGSINAPWGYVPTNEVITNSKKLIDVFDCNSSLLLTDPEKVMTCMRNVKAELLSKEQWNSIDSKIYAFRPSLDGNIYLADPMSMLKILDMSDYDIMLGNVKNEGTLPLITALYDALDKDELSELSYKKYKDIMNIAFSEHSEAERDVIISKYSPLNKNESTKYQLQIAQAIGDYYLTCPSYNYGKGLAKQGANVHYYIFDHRSSISFWGKWLGVMHGDDVSYLFAHPLNEELHFSSEEKELSKYMVKVLVHFAKTGKPLENNEEWPNFTADNPVYYKFGTKSKSKKFYKTKLAKTCKFWTESLTQQAKCADCCPKNQNISMQSLLEILKSLQKRIKKLGSIKDLNKLNKLSLGNVGGKFFLKYSTDDFPDNDFPDDNFLDDDILDDHFLKYDNYTMDDDNFFGDTSDISTYDIESFFKRQKPRNEMENVMKNLLKKGGVNTYVIEYNYNSTRSGKKDGNDIE